MNNEQLLNEEMTARHEAGHAVMHWLLRGEVPAISVSGKIGVCHASDADLTHVENVFYSVAGYIVEKEYKLGDWNLEEAKVQDFEAAKLSIRSGWPLPLSNGFETEPEDIETPSDDELFPALREFINKATGVLAQYEYAVQEIVDAFQGKRAAEPQVESITLGPDEMESLLSKYERPEDKQWQV